MPASVLENNTEVHIDVAARPHSGRRLQALSLGVVSRTPGATPRPARPPRSGGTAPRDHRRGSGSEHARRIRLASPRSPGAHPTNAGIDSRIHPKSGLWWGGPGRASARASRMTHPAQPREHQPPVAATPPTTHPRRSAPMAHRCRCQGRSYSIADPLMSRPQHLRAIDVVSAAPGNDNNGPSMRSAGHSLGSAGHSLGSAGAGWAIHARNAGNPIMPPGEARSRQRCCNASASG
jgi:hypothetical protein